MKRILFIFCAILAFAPYSNAQITWVGAASGGNWGTASNWSGGAVPVATDEVVISNGGNMTFTGLAATQSVGQLKIQSNTNVTFDVAPGASATIATAVLTVAGLAGVPDLLVASGSSMTFTGTQPTANIYGLVMALPAGATGEILGNVTITANGTGTFYTHSLQGASASAIAFKSGSTCTMGPNVRANPFNGSGSFTAGANSVTFENGSTFTSLAGATAFGGTTANCVFNPTSNYIQAQSGAISAGNRTFGNLEINNASYASTSTGSSAMTVGGNLTITAGNPIFNVSAGVNVKGNLTIALGASLAVGAGVLFNLNGLGAQQVIAVNGALTFADATAILRLSNVINGGRLTTPLTVKTFNHSGGKLVLDNNDLTITANYTGGSATSYVVTNGTGKLKIQGVTTAKLFNVGASAASYDPVTIDNATGVADEFAVNVGTTLPYPTYDNTQAVNRAWNISEANPMGSVVTLSLTPNDLTTNAAGGVFTVGNVMIGRANGSNYTGIPATNNTGTVTSSVPITSFSSFIIANDVAIPVELRGFYAQLLSNNQVALTWQTASEKNNNGFEIQRSMDGHNWTKIGFVKGNGTTNAEQKYNFTDERPLSINYYRLRQLDFDGKETVSKTLTINTKGKWTTRIFPNPVTNVMTIDVGEVDNAAIRLVDVLGKQIIAKQGQTGQSSLDVSLLSAGIYFVEIKANGRVVREKIVKQ